MLEEDNEYRLTVVVFEKAKSTQQSEYKLEPELDSSSRVHTLKLLGPV
jgi:hypothetical protein